MTRFSDLFRPWPPVDSGPTSLTHWVLAATPWALVAVLALALLAR